MERLDLDAMFCYGTEGSYRNLVYFANYQPSFEVGGVLIGRTGLPLVLNASETLEYAATNAFGLSRVRPCAAFDHTPNPILPQGVRLHSLRELLDEVCEGKPCRRLGLGDFGMIPHPLFLELQAAVGTGELVNCDEEIEHLRMNKSPREIELLEAAGVRSEKAFEAALGKITPEMTLFEVQGVFAKELYMEGGEGLGFMPVCFSGPLTRCSIGRSKHVRVGEGQILSLGFGCRYGGYCGSYSRPVIFGKFSDRQKREIDFMIGLHQKLAEEWLKSGVTTGQIALQYQQYFADHGFGANPGAPCHGIGIMEDEEPIFQIGGDFVLKENMTVAVDNYFRNDLYGFRFEDVAVLQQNGARLFTGRNWDYIEL